MQSAFSLFLSRVKYVANKPRSSNQFHLCLLTCKSVIGDFGILQPEDHLTSEISTYYQSTYCYTIYYTYDSYEIPTVWWYPPQVEPQPIIPQEAPLPRGGPPLAGAQAARQRPRQRGAGELGQGEGRAKEASPCDRGALMFLGEIGWWLSCHGFLTWFCVVLLFCWCSCYVWFVEFDWFVPVSLLLKV